MWTLFLHAASLAAILALVRRLVYRPIVDRLAEHERRLEERLSEMRELADTVTSSIAAFDHVRTAATDLVRQEVRKIADAAVEDVRRRTVKVPETFV